MRRRQHGFFLVEVLLALALVALVAVAAVRLAATLTHGTARRRAYVQAILLAEAAAADRRTRKDLPDEGGFDLAPDFRFRYLPGATGAEAVEVRGEGIRFVLPLAAAGAPAR